MTDSTPETSTDELAAALQQGATVVDVRETDEYVAGHVPAARHIPMGQLPSRLHELDRSGAVHVVCASDNRSAAMTDLLTHTGLTAYSVAGGTSSWARSGRDVVTGTNPTA